MTTITYEHKRRSIRLKDYDYTQSSAYFITVCTEKRHNILGNVIDSKMYLNKFGQIVADSWIWFHEQYSYVELDEWIIMPNHLHGIIVTTAGLEGGSRTAPTDVIKYKSLGRLIGAFKTISTKQINEVRSMPGAPIWQRNYYEHIIRNEEDLNECREYIINNPIKWELDSENPKNINIRSGLRPASRK